jgi:hypothetical protein
MLRKEVEEEFCLLAAAAEEGGTRDGMIDFAAGGCSQQNSR